MTEHHSAISHAAYHDLLRALQDEQASEIKGTPRLEKRDGRLYWYDMFRIGSDVRKRYLGEDTPELADRISRHKALAEASADRAAERTRLIRILRAEGFQQTDATTGSLLTAMAKSGTFRLGGTIVGTHAFRLYEGELGIRFRLADILQTDGLGIAPCERLSLAVADQVEPSFQNPFQSLDFELADVEIVGLE